ncbi:MAG TPA: tetratricopeptide repeat-containing protein, partial [Stellaceae bacterium]|nr:tetratricopeptide repeat-containing protein [Stellaceae bacterium]
MNETAPEPVRSLSVFIKRLSEVTKQSDSQLVLAACQELVEYARSTAQVPDPAAAREVLELLRGSRHFEALSVLADALIRMGRDELIVSRHYVQGLIDQGLLIAAREVLGGVIRRSTDDPNEYSEARGLMGRLNKQIYVDARGRPSDLARRALRQAIACYREVYDEDPQKHVWHGVNLLALMHRAR